MPSFISFRGRRYYDPSVVIDVNNNLITPSAGEKSLCVVGNFPVLPKGVTHTFGPSQQFEVSDLYPKENQLLDYNKIFKNSIRDEFSSASRLTFVNAGANAGATHTLAMQGGGGYVLTAKKFGLKGNDIQIRIEGPSTPVTDANNDTLDVLGNKYRIIIKEPGFDVISRDVGYASQLSITYTDNDAQEGRFCKVEILPISNIQNIRVSKFDDQADNALIEAVITAAAAVAAKTAEIVALDANDDGTPDDPADQAALNVLIAARVALNTTLTTATTARDAAIDVTTRPLSEFPAMDDLATFISGLDDRLQAQPLNFDVAPEHLDNVSLNFADVANAPVTHTLHAHSFAVSDNLKSLDIPFTIALDAANGFKEFVEATDSLDPANLADRIFSQFSGGTFTDATVLNYREVLLSLNDKDFTTVAVLDTRRSVHKEVEVYNQNSLDNLRERNYYLPAAADQTIAQIYSDYVLPLNNSRFSVVGQKIDYKGADGVTTIRGTTSDFAFLAMCLQGALPVAQAATLYEPNIVQVYQAWNRERDVGDMIKNGIYGIGKDLKIARSITTHVKNNLTSEVEVSARESVDTTARELRKSLHAKLGAQILTSTSGQLSKLVNDALTSYVEAQFIKGYRNVSVSITDDTAFISFDLEIVKPLNFISVNINLI